MMSTISDLKLIKIAKYGIWQFFVLTIVAMILFPGGTIHNADLTHYSFLNNFFSDLGRTEDFKGNVNPSRWIFTTALTIAGISMFAFFNAIPTIFKNYKRFDRLKYVTQILGLITSICYVGVAFTPWDKYILGHEISVKVGFLAYFILSLILTYLMYKDESYPNFYAHVFVLFNCTVFVYIYILFFGPESKETQRALSLQVISQKIVVYAEIICMLIQMHGAQLVLKKQSVMGF